VTSYPGGSEAAAGRSATLPARQRRSCRLALSIPIRVYAIDFRGNEFIEDAATLVVNLHGAKIRLIRQLIPELEFRLLSLPTRQEGHPARAAAAQLPARLVHPHPCVCHGLPGKGVR